MKAKVNVELQRLIKDSEQEMSNKNQPIWYKASLQVQIDKLDEMISTIKKDTKLYIESIDDDYEMVGSSSNRSIYKLELVKQQIEETMDRVDKNEK